MGKWDMVTNWNCSGIFTKWPFIHCFQIELEFGVLVFEEGENRRNRRKTLVARDENQLQTQPTSGFALKSTPGHIGARRAFSPLHHPC